MVGASKKFKEIVFFVFLFLILTLNLASAAHYIVGYVEDARDGTLANGHSVVLWNPLFGTENNLTDIIGPAGNSGADNIYMIDCEMLSNPCNVGDTLNVKVYDTGDSYVSETKSVVVTGAGYTLAPNITLNSPPSVNLNSPENNQILNSETVSFNCSVNDLDENLQSVALYGNWTGNFSQDQINYSSLNTDYIFLKTLEDGYYHWNCLATDNLSVSNFSSKNNSFVLDTTPPEIYSVELNSTYSCGTSQYVRVSCSTNDSLLNVSNVTIQADFPSLLKLNYSASFLSGITYYADIQINESGSWKFTCYSNDSAGNINSLESGEFISHPEGVDLIVYSEYINFSDLNPVENQKINITAVIFNNGCSDSGNFLTTFYQGDPDLNQPIGNTSSFVSARSNQTVNVPWNAQIGPNYIYVYADSEQEISEHNKTNNIDYTIFNVGSWQTFFGNISLNKILGAGRFNMSVWLNESSIQGNIFVTAKESVISWISLQALGRTKTGEASNNDFSELDSVLNMSDFEDSIENTFTENNEPRDYNSFFVHKNLIENVSIINSTENSQFITGILWDTSDSLSDNYNSTEKQDIIFVSKVIKETQGEYGIYDYEITVPVRLREYYDTETTEFYFYYDLN